MHDMSETSEGRDAFQNALGRLRVVVAEHRSTIALPFLLSTASGSYRVYVTSRVEGEQATALPHAAGHIDYVTKMIQIAADQTPEAAMLTLAHEFMHAETFATPLFVLLGETLLERNTEHAARLGEAWRRECERHEIERHLRAAMAEVVAREAART